MDKRVQHGGSAGQPDPRYSYIPLARWLQDILAISPQPAPPERTSLLETAGHPLADYHPAYYQQIPDFIMALLKDDSQATLRYAPLFYHLIGCPVCHTAYLELYNAMRAALTPGGELPVMEGGTQSLAMTPPRMLVYMCQLLLKQAEAVLIQARRDHSNYDAWARALLQQAIFLSSHILESVLRQRALQELVRVATLALGTDETDQPEQDSQVYPSYTSLVGTGSGVRKANKTRRRAEMLEHPVNEASIDLQAGSLEGTIVQEGEILQLLLHDLDESMRGRHVLISVPLGSLLEPVRWVGKNPRAIRSQYPVDEHGFLKTPLGTTDLQLTDREDRNLLEAMFKKLDIRPET
jgi:hypothetical protein